MVFGIKDFDLARSAVRPRAKRVGVCYPSPATFSLGVYLTNTWCWFVLECSDFWYTLGVENFNFEIFDQVPEELVEQVDKLLEADESNNRVRSTDSLSEYSKERYFTPQDRFKYVVALNKDEVVGIILLFKKEIDFKSKKILLGGIGGVGTKAEYRDKGIATKMLSMVGEILQEVGCDVGFLDADIEDPKLVKIYGRIGYVILGRDTIFSGKSGKKYFSPDGMIAPVNSQELFEEVLKAKEPFNIGQGVW